ncbi:hypothetical protein KSP40_PGU006719 [Platanthera guangdongensis]|uniref:WD repeat-containing protein 44 n=1 Tax=Platanthera guangdongensis TaxID=2320717 RepID=A0ABR2LN99_9ASPA
MGLAHDPSLDRAKPYGDESSYDSLRPRSNLTRVTSITGAFSRSRSDGSVEPRVLRRQQASVSGKPPLIDRSRPSFGGEVELEVLEGNDRRNWEDAKMCTIKDLGSGAEFVVKEFGEDGMWKNLRDVGSGRQLSMEEFDLCVGSSPAVQELMRRPDVEESGIGSGVSSDRSKDGGESYGDGMSKRRSSWLKSLKNVVSAGHWQDWRSSEEKDTSSEKGERRSSSATDDSQEAQDAVQSILHGPELVKVRQYGKSHKELSGLFLSQEIQAHNGSIWTIKFSLDSRYLASAGEDFVVHVWQVYEKDRTPDISVDRAGEEDDNGDDNGDILPEEMLLISGMEGSHWEKKKGSNGSNGRKSVSLDNVMVPEQVFTISERPICSFTGHLDDVLDLSWSKSQYLLSSSMDKTVRLWHLSSSSCLKIFSHSDYVTCVQFNPIDDRYFISGSLDAKVRLWSIPDGRVVDWNDLHEIVTAACYTPDGQGALVGSNEGHCYLYDTSENMLLQKSQVELHSKKQRSIHKKITGFQFTPGCSREVLITSADSRIRVMDGSNLIQKFKGFRNTSSQISAFPTANGKYVICASEDSRVYVWRYDTGARPSKSKTAVNVCQSYEYFHSMGVTTAVPWPSSGSTKCKLDDFNNNSDRSAWGMVIVTAGGGGEIRIYQNHGLPVRV